MENPRETVRQMALGTSSLRQGIPETLQAFTALGKAAYADGALSERTKELIALAIAITGKCEGCIAHHTRTLAHLQTPREEVLEMIGICIQMGGGPALVYGGQAIQAFDAFHEE